MEPTRKVGAGRRRGRGEAAVRVSSLPFPLFLILRKSEVEANGEMNKNMPQK